MPTSPMTPAEALAAARDEMGPLLDDLLTMKSREAKHPGSTYYLPALAALIDHRWPVTTLATLLGETYATIQGSLSSEYTNRALPESAVIPDYPDTIIHALRSAQRGPAMDPAVADFVRRLDAASNNNRERFHEYGGTDEQFDTLTETYTRDGLLAIGSAALQRESARGVPNSALVSGLGRTYTSLAQRLRLTLDADNGWAVYAPNTHTSAARRRYVLRSDLPRRTPGQDLTEPGHAVTLEDVPTSPYATNDTTAPGDTRPLFSN